VAAPAGVIAHGGGLPRLLYIGDVSVADTMAGEALLFRLLQFYPPDRLAIVCGVRPGMPMLPGAAYHHWGAAVPRLLHSRVAEEYILWRAWRYYEVPWPIASVATMFRPDAILTISHVSGWLGAWQLALRRRIPFHLIAHDDLAYVSRFPAWSRPWIEARFGDAYRAARSRLCISDTMAEVYERRFGAAGQVIYPTHKGGQVHDVSPRASEVVSRLTFAYGGSINSRSDMAQIVAFGKAAAARGHRLIAYTPQHAELASLAAAEGAAIDARAPIHSDLLLTRFRDEADCLFLPQSMTPQDYWLVATAFPTKWADYATVGLPVLVWAPAHSSSARFVGSHPGCAELVTTTDISRVDAAIAGLAASPARRRQLAQALRDAGRGSFSPEAAWQTFQMALAQPASPDTRQR
jgi:hypothetical protein